MYSEMNMWECPAVPFRNVHVFIQDWWLFAALLWFRLKQCGCELNALRVFCCREERWDLFCCVYLFCVHPGWVEVRGLNKSTKSAKSADPPSTVLDLVAKLHYVFLPRNKTLFSYSFLFILCANFIIPALCGFMMPFVSLRWSDGDSVGVTSGGRSSRGQSSSLFFRLQTMQLLP